MCSIISHDKQQPTYADGKISGGGRPIPKNETTELLEALDATLNFIYFWLEFFHRNYEEIYIMYHGAIKKLFKKTPTIKSKPLSHDKKHQKLLIDIGDHWYMEKNTKGIPPIIKHTVSEKSQEKNDKVK